MPSLTQRHRALQQRSFARHLNLFLTVQFGRGLDFAHLRPELYEQFIPTLQEWGWYVRSQQAKSLSDPFLARGTIRELDEALTAWGAKEDVAAFRQVHDKVHCVDLAEFAQLFAAYPLSCAYCHLTQEEFAQLHQAGQLRTKRLRTRGTSFEVDCVEPRLGYRPGNVVVCCYWCNNAKTDEFTDGEFLVVARALEQVWRERLATS